MEVKHVLRQHHWLNQYIRRSLRPCSKPSMVLEANARAAGRHHTAPPIRRASRTGWPASRWHRLIENNRWGSSTVLLLRLARRSVIVVSLQWAVTPERAKAARLLIPVDQTAAKLAKRPKDIPVACW